MDLQVGEAFDVKIGNIRNICFDHNSGIFEQCLEKYIPELTSSVAAYKADGDKVRSRVRIMTGLGFMNYGICIDEPNDNFWKLTKAAEQEAAKCIKPE